MSLYNAYFFDSGLLSALLHPDQIDTGAGEDFRVQFRFRGEFLAAVNELSFQVIDFYGGGCSLCQADLQRICAAQRVGMRAKLQPGSVGIRVTGVGAGVETLIVGIVNPAATDARIQ